MGKVTVFGFLFVALFSMALAGDLAADVAEVELASVHGEPLHLASFLHGDHAYLHGNVQHHGIIAPIVESHHAPLLAAAHHPVYGHYLHHPGHYYSHDALHFRR